VSSSPSDQVADGGEGGKVEVAVECTVSACPTAGTYCQALGYKEHIGRTSAGSYGKAKKGPLRYLPSQSEMEMPFYYEDRPWLSLLQAISHSGKSYGY